MKKRAILSIFGALAALTLIGCTDTSNARDLKREEDRLAIDLSRVQKERDQYRAKLEAAQSGTSDDEKKLQAQIDDLQAKLDSRDQELSDLRKRLRAAEAAAQPTLPTSRPAQP